MLNNLNILFFTKDKNKKKLYNKQYIFNFAVQNNYERLHSYSL